MNYLVLFVAASAFLLCIYTGFLPLLFSALLAYGIVKIISQRMVSLGNHSDRSNLIAVSAVALFVVLCLLGVGFAANSLVHNDTGLAALANEMSRILEASGQLFPEWIASGLPEKDQFLHVGAEWLKEHANAIGAIGVKTLKVFGYIIIGIIIGAMIAVRTTVSSAEYGPISGLLSKQVTNINEAFWRVLTAQVKISALNTVLTAVYLLLIMPLVFGAVPLAKTLVLVTFIVGLLPVIGNIISNTAIVVMSLTLGGHAAAASLIFLIVVHKLEYFINARFVGAQINAQAYEILLVILVGEHFFGLAGVIAGPIFYAWFKREWQLVDKIKDVGLEAQ